MIEEAKLQEWERISNEATDGPWYAYEGRDYSEIHERTATHARALALVGSKHKDAMFIAAARDAVPQLIAEVRRLAKLAGEHFAQAVRHDEEADWLAEQLEHTTEYCIKTHSDSDHCDKWFEDCECAKCWRQAAREAVSND